MRRWSLLLVAVFVVALGACKVDTTVTVKVDGDGSGEVVARVALDADAVRAVEAGGVKLENAIRLQDLAAAGWESSGWVQHGKGSGAVLTLSKSFPRAEDAAKVVEELNGPDGPLRDVSVERDVSTFRTDWTFRGFGDLEDLKTGITNDPELVARLTAARVDVAALDQTLLATTKDAFRLQVVSDLPGASPKRFPIPPGTSVSMHDSTSQTARTRVLLFGAAFLAVIVAVVLFLLGEARDQRKRRAYARTLPSAGKGVDLFEPRIEPGGEPDE